MKFLGRRDYPTLVSSDVSLLFRCEDCGRLDFCDVPAEKPVVETPCLACGAALPDKSDNCRNCGWAWRTFGGPSPDALWPRSLTALTARPDFGAWRYA